MGRQRRIFCSILTVLAVLTTSCSTFTKQEESVVKILWNTGSMHTRALNPEEDKISNVSILIFDQDGNAEECIWLPNAHSGISVSLISGNTYRIRACANFGYQVYADHIDEIEEITYHLAYPDEYQEGIPMFASTDDYVAGSTETLTLEFKRLMAKISLKIDRSRLSENITMNVLSARIGNCPKVVNITGPSKISGQSQCFNVGFHRGEFETEPLNISGPNKTSGDVSLYMLENMQGNISPELTSDQDKVFSPEDPRSKTCSYIELELEYMSLTHYSSTKNLIYRFYLGDSLNNLDVERNCHYRITVRPEDDGLSGNGWRVDKSGITDRGPVSFAAYPKSYIRGNIGDQVHIWCEFNPPQAPFDVGVKYMEDDKREGIYDYKIDDDGHGATLTFTGPGQGLIYMEAGDPVNEAALFIIEVNQPDPTEITDTEPYEIPDNL